MTRLVGLDTFNAANTNLIVPGRAQVSRLDNWQTIAVATGNANVGYLYISPTMSGGYSTNIKLLCYTAPGGVLLGESEVRLISGATHAGNWEPFTFSSPIAITQGVPYGVGWIHESGSFPIHQQDTVDFRAQFDDGGTFASPPDPFTSDGNFNWAPPCYLAEEATGFDVTVKLTNIDGVPRSNLTGLKWAWYDVWPAPLFPPTDTGGSETTDANGNMTVSIANSGLTTGQTGYLVVRGAGTESNIYPVVVP